MNMGQYIVTGERAEAKASTFKDLNGIIASFGKAIRERDIKSVEDKGFSVTEHSATIRELRDMKPITGIEPKVEPALGFSSVWRSHKAVEGLFEGICLSEFVGETKHNIHSILIFLKKLVIMSEEKPPGAFEVSTLFLRQHLLKLNPDILHGLSTVSNDVKPIDNDLGIREESKSEVAEALVHIHNNILDIGLIVKFLEIVMDIRRVTGRKYIEDTVFFGISDNTLKLLTISVSLKFVKRECARELLRIPIFN